MKHLFRFLLLFVAAVASAQTNFFQDTFTGTAGTSLTAHTPDLGAGWTLQYGSGTTPTLNGSGFLDAGTGTNYLHFKGTATPPGANYIVESTITVGSSPSTGYFIAARVTNDFASYNGYYFGFWGAYGGFRIFTAATGNGSVGSYAGMPSPGVHVLKLDVSGSLVRGYLDGVLIITANGGIDTTYGLAGSVGQVIFGGTAGDVLVNEFKAYTGGGGVTSGAPSVVGKSNTTASVDVGMATGGTAPYTYQWHRGTSNGFTPGAGNAVSGATSRLLNDSGLSSAATYYYVCTVTDATSATANSTQLTLTTTNNAEFAPNHSSVVWAPKVWVTDGNASTTNCWGAYGYFLTDAATTSISLVVDNSTFAGVEPPVLAYSVAGGPIQAFDLGRDVYSPTLATVSAGTQRLVKIYYKCHADGQNNFTDDYWNGPAVRVSIKKIVLNSGASLVAITPRPRKVALLGDSNTRSPYLTGAIDAGDALSGFAATVGYGLDAEYAQIGGAGSGIVVAGGNNWPSLLTSWSLNWAGQTRTFSDFGPNDVIIIRMGDNDHTQADATITSNLNTIVAGIRSQTSAWICIREVSAKWTAISAVTLIDSKVKLLPRNGSAIWGVPSFGSTGSATGQTIDGAHFTLQGHAVEAADIIKQVQEATGGTAGGSRAWAF
ncbi:MAG: hypothetical protein NTV51_12230 [Verrucomicrobia bacterium]|nr:hypothetical protein [Verrucomicrobiota bacterium]